VLLAKTSKTTKNFYFQNSFSISYYDPNNFFSACDNEELLIDYLIVWLHVATA